MRLGVSAALIRGRLLSGDVEVVDGTIAAYGLASPNGRGIAVPGFVDLQVNGFGGVDLLEADAEGFRKAGDAMLESGVTAYLPTFITASTSRDLFSLRRGSGRILPPRAATRMSPCSSA
jgi:N-acetylglucosamine-6-phosphate deacetylase